MHLEAVDKEVGVRLAPRKGPELHDADEASQVKYLPLLVLAVTKPCEKEELGALVYLPPEAVLEGLLRLLHRLVVPQAVHVRQHPHDLGEAVYLRTAWTVSFVASYIA